MMRNGLSRIAIIAFALMQPLAAAHAQAPRPGPRATGPVAADPDLEVVQVAADVYMIGGAGGNITVNVGSNGLFVVDTGTASGEREGSSRHPRDLGQADSLHHRHQRRCRPYRREHRRQRDRPGDSDPRE